MSMGTGLEIVVAGLGEAVDTVAQQKRKIEEMEKDAQKAGAWVKKLIGAGNLESDEFSPPWNVGYEFRNALADED